MRRKCQGGGNEEERGEKHGDELREETRRKEGRKEKRGEKMKKKRKNCYEPRNAEMMVAMKVPITHSPTRLNLIILISIQSGM
jgi:hypothetical protein